MRGFVSIGNSVHKIQEMRKITDFIGNRLTWLEQRV